MIARTTLSVVALAYATSAASVQMVEVQVYDGDVGGCEDAADAVGNKYPVYFDGQCVITDTGSIMYSCGALETTAYVTSDCTGDADPPISFDNVCAAISTSQSYMLGCAPYAEDKLATILIKQNCDDSAVDMTMTPLVTGECMILPLSVGSKSPTYYLEISADGLKGALTMFENSPDCTSEGTTVELTIDQCTETPDGTFATLESATDANLSPTPPSTKAPKPTIVPTSAASTLTSATSLLVAWFVAFAAVMA